MPVYIENFSPQLATGGGDTAVRNQEDILFTLTPEDVDLEHVWIWCKTDEDERTFVVYDDEGFRFPFSTRSRRYVRADGSVRFQIQKIGGWVQDITDLEVCTIDSDNVLGPEFRPNFVIPLGGFTAGKDGGSSPGPTDDELDITHPIGLAAGDLLVASLQSGSGSGAFSLPVGWTLIGQYSLPHFGGGTNHLACYKVATASDVSAGFTKFNRGSGAGACAGVLAGYTNIHPTQPVLTSLNLVGTDGGDPEVVCPGPSCHEEAISGTGSYTLWGPGFLTPRIPGFVGCMAVHTMGGGSGGSGSPPAPTAPDTASRVTTGSWVMAGAIGQSSTIRTRVAAQGYHAVPAGEESLELPAWSGGLITSNAACGTTMILRPKEFF